MESEKCLRSAVGNTFRSKICGKVEAGGTDAETGRAVV